MPVFKLDWNLLAAAIFWMQASLFNACVEERSLSQIQSTPGMIAFRSDRIWQSLSAKWAAEVESKREQLRLSLLVFKKKHQLEEPLREPPKTEIATRGTYGQLPEVYVDVERGAIFPFPVSKPNRFSWFQVGLIEKNLLRKFKQLEQDLTHFDGLKPADGNVKEMAKKHFETLTSKWNETNEMFITLTQQIRYLMAWLPLLIKEQQEEIALGLTPLGERLVQSQQENQSNLDTLRDILRPHRVVKQKFLPEHLELIPAGIISVPIVTDILDKKFLAEIDGAVMTHWNQSSWAKKAEISFHIQWRFQKPNLNFANKKETMAQHLSHFPTDAAIITTGGLSTHVGGAALILGPGKITPRTLAHEFGHLIGFNDCYFRTLSGQGMFGLAVLEWDNSFYPDDIMCDNSSGEPRVEVW